MPYIYPSIRSNVEAMSADDELGSALPFEAYYVHLPRVVEDNRPLTGSFYVESAQINFASELLCDLLRTLLDCYNLPSLILLTP